MYSRNALTPLIVSSSYCKPQSVFIFLLFLPCLPSCLSMYKRSFFCPHFFFLLIEHKCLYYFISLNILSSDCQYVSWSLVVCKDTNYKFNYNTHTYQYNLNLITKSQLKIQYFIFTKNITSKSKGCINCAEEKIVLVLFFMKCSVILWIYISFIISYV